MFERVQDTDDNTADFTQRTSDSQACGVCTAATPTVSVSDTSVQEGDAGATTAQLTLSLGRPVTVPVTVGIATRDETGCGAKRRRERADTVVFAPGERTKTVPVTVVGDLQPEPEEAFVLELSVPAGVLAADPSGRVTISDDDEADAGSTPCTVFALGRVEGRTKSLLVVAAHYKRGAAAPRGFVAYADPASRTRLVFSSVTSLVAAGDRATLVGTAFRLELGPEKRFSLSFAGGSVSGALHPGGIALRCASP